MLILSMLQVNIICMVTLYTKIFPTEMWTYFTTGGKQVSIIRAVNVRNID